MPSRVDVVVSKIVAKCRSCAKNELRNSCRTILIEQARGEIFQVVSFSSADHHLYTSHVIHVLICESSDVAEEGIFSTDLYRCRSYELQFTSLVRTDRGGQRTDIHA